MSSISATTTSSSGPNSGKGCRFVTRLKKNTPVTVVAERPVPAGTDSHTAARTKKTAAVFLTALRNALFHRIKLEILGGRIERRHASPDQVPSAQLEFAV